MNLKEENNPPVSRFGFRLKPAKNSVDKKHNVDGSEKNDFNDDNISKVKNDINKHLNKQQTVVAVKDCSSSFRKKKTNAGELYSDQHSATSNDSNSSISMVVKKIPCGGSTFQQPTNCSRGHLLQVDNHVALRRSRSRDACRELKVQNVVKEKVKVRDQSLKSVKARSKSRETSLKSVDVKHPSRVNDKCVAMDKSLQKKYQTPGIETHLVRGGRSSANINSNNSRNSENNSNEKESLRSDLNFLRKKLEELKGILSASSPACKTDISSVKEENIILREENTQLKEKIQNLEQELDAKLKQITEMNEKLLAAMNYSPISIEDDVKNLHDSSLNSFNHKLTKKLARNKNLNEILTRDSNENITCNVDLAPNLKNTNPSLTCTSNEVGQPETPQVEQKTKRTSQLPTRFTAKKSLIIPNNNLKANFDKDVSSTTAGYDKTTLGQYISEDSKRFNLPSMKSQRFIK